MTIDLFTEYDTERLVRYIKENSDPNKPILFWVDLFCGCGGVTEGFTKMKNSFVVACVNHDPYAIKSHHANHPRCIHYTEDIRDWAVIFKIENLCKRLREVFPNAFFGLHASLECTHFSKAKGGLSRDEDSRTLANHLFKYLRIPFDYVTIENVEEFLTWGPLYQVSKMEKGKKMWKFQNKKRKIFWFDKPYVEDKPFFDECKIGPFMLPIKERKCEFYNEWKKEMKTYGLHYDYQVLNAADYGAFTSRKRYFGVFALKHLKILFPEQTHISKSKHHLKPHLKVHNAVKEKLELQEVGRSIFGKNSKGKPYVDKTITRVLGGLEKTIEEREKYFLSAYYGNSQEGRGITTLDLPCNTIPTKDRFYLHYILYEYGNACYSSIYEPAGSVTTTPKHNLISLSRNSLQWLWDFQYDRKACSIYNPSPTVIARQDKAPLSMASVIPFSMVDHSVELSTDSPARKEIKAFMRKYGIKDVYIRPLFVKELLRIQGFPEDYTLLGGKTRAKKYIGNSVAPDMSQALCESIYDSINLYLDAA